jgi:hypothetical protein
LSVYQQRVRGLEVLSQHRLPFYILPGLSSCPPLHVLDVLTNLLSSFGELIGGLPIVCVVVIDVAIQVVTSSLKIRRPWRLIALLTMPRTLAMAALGATRTGLSWRA